MGGCDTVCAACAVACVAAYAPGNKCVYYGCRRRWCPWMCATADCGALSLRAGSRRDGLPESRVEARRGRGRPRLGMADVGKRLPYNRNRTRTPLLALGRPFARFSSRYRKLRFRLRHSRVAWECGRSSARPTDAGHNSDPLPLALTGLKLTSQTSSFSHLREKKKWRHSTHLRARIGQVR